MAYRTQQNPGVELNEIDRSFYGKIDNSLPNAPVSFIAGVADQGESMTFEWIDSKATLNETFGIPTTEFESYFYNAAIEVLNRGGICIASKLPYKNAQHQMYNYVDFDVSFVKMLDQLDAPTDYATIGDIHDSLQIVLDQLSDDQYTSIETINDMANAIIGIHEKYNKDEIIINEINDLSSQLANFISSYVQCYDNFSLMYFNDTNLTSYLNILAHPTSQGEGDSYVSAYGGMTHLSVLDNLLTHQQGCLLKNKIRIYDMTRAKYQSLENCQCISSDSISAWTNECLGIIPVIVTPVNALLFQNLLDCSQFFIDEKYAHTIAKPNYEAYNNLSTYSTVTLEGIHQSMSGLSAQMSTPIASTSLISSMSIVDVDSLSRRSAKQFPAINYYNAGHFDQTNLKKIGVLVFKAFKDTSNYGKISFQLLESFVGSLDKHAQDQTTKANIFIDNIVNQNSQFIRLFSTVDQSIIEQASTIAMSQQPAVSLGFYKEQCKKDISFIDTIMKPLAIVLDKASNANQLPLDLVVDAGMSNIAQLAKIQPDGTLHTDLMPSIGDYQWKFGYASSDVSGWKAILQKFDNFCKNSRKDCMFIADGLRPLCLDGNVKIVRPTKPDNSVTNAIIPNFRYIAGAIDSSYAAGYCNWYLQVDYSNNTSYIWIPPSIKAMGACIYCDTYFHPWNAPAGHTRGLVRDAIDVAFVPSDDDAGVIYNNSWNYAMSYPIDGVVIEGHKTFQSQRTALDRINVRRLMLYLEKRVARVARAFVYEQNTPYMRQQLVDTIRPILEDAVSGSGISEYAIKCDEEINTPQVVDNNEMRCKIAVRPIKVVDWIVINLICLNQTASINEELAR